MENNKTIPKIRFTGFTDAWEQRRLGEVANHRGGTAIEKHFDNSGKYKVISIGSYGLDSKYVDQNIRAISNEITDARVVRKGELTMVLNDKTSNGTIIGRSLLINTDDEYVINQRTEIISPKENLDSDFAYVVLNGPFREKVKRIVQGGTQIYVNYPAVENLEFELPSIEEQQKIGDFFIQLDHLITLHQRKYDKTISIKNVMLEKLFPKDSENLPEINFLSFAITWEQRKVSDIADIFGGGTPSTSNPEYWDGDIDWYAPAEMEGQRYAVGSVKKITELGLQKSSAQMLPAGRTVLFTSRAGIGKMAILQRSAATNQGFQSIVLKDGTNPYFIYSMGSELKKKAEGIASGSTFLEISGKMLGNLVIAMPSKQEQDKIACYFEKIDDLITLHQRKPFLQKRR